MQRNSQGGTLESKITDTFLHLKIVSYLKKFISATLYFHMKKHQPRLKASRQAGFFLWGNPEGKQLNKRKWTRFLKQDQGGSGPAFTPLNSNYTKGDLLPLRRLYGMRLRAKQTLKAFYGGIGEKQFKKLYNQSNFKSLQSKRHLVQLLESRFDATIFRLGFARSIFEAKQLIRHGAFSLNGKVHSTKSSMLVAHDLIEVNKSHRSRVASNVMKLQRGDFSYPASNILVSYETLSAIYTGDVPLTEVQYHGAINFKNVKEFYI